MVRIAAETAIGLGPYSFPYSFFTSEKGCAPNFQARNKFLLLVALFS